MDRQKLIVMIKSEVVRTRSQISHLTQLNLPSTGEYGKLEGLQYVLDMIDYEGKIEKLQTDLVNTLARVDRIREEIAEIEQGFDTYE